MNLKSKISLFAAVVSIAAFPAARALAFESPAEVSSAEAAVESTAARMVTAHASLSQSLSASKTKAGQQFTATLKDPIKLADGTELPRGTVLSGAVDSTETRNKSTLSLSFTQAQLKDGKSIPIKVTIMHMDPSGELGSTSTWNPKMHGVSQQNVLGGVDLESQISDTTSGTLIATKKDKIKLSKGCALTLAIGVAQGS